MTAIVPGVSKGKKEPRKGAARRRSGTPRAARGGGPLGELRGAADAMINQLSQGSPGPGAPAGPVTRVPYPQTLAAPPTSDPRELSVPGRVAIGSEEFFDPRNVVLLHACQPALIAAWGGGDPNGQRLVALQMEGRVNKSDAEVAHMYLVDAEGLASVVAELMNTGEQASPDWPALLAAELDTRAAVKEAERTLAAASRQETDWRAEFPPERLEIMYAAVDLVGRVGAQQLQFGYLHEDRPAEEAAWYAYAQYGGTRISADDHPGPIEALQALAERLLTGAKCSCGRLVSLSDDGAFAFHETRLADGSTFTAEQAAAAGLCQWRRIGPRWETGCPPGDPFAEGTAP